MDQLTQQLKSGKMEIVEVPIPQLMPGQVLVRNYYSVISAGTEGRTVSDARKGYIAKARSRQKEVKQVLDLVRQQGLKAAYDIVMNKLEALSPLGYSCAGEVIAVGNGVKEIKPGDFVACGGGSASHAEVVAVPKNLCVKLNPGVELSEAAFITIASIALQGIRQAEVQLGGNCVVIGLGLVGILTMKLLEASGIQAFGIDISSDAVMRAKAKFSFRAATTDEHAVSQQILEWSKGKGTDAVIITAGSSSLEPINLAGELARQKGKVVVVGAVPTGFDRKNYYRKELDLRMSCSYGPGRYDSNYEEKGIDYPIAYARWTEQRNMQTIADLLSARKISFSDIITHTFPLDTSPDAYNLILEKKKPYLGIVIEYEKQEKPEKLEDYIVFDTKPADPDKVDIGIIGSGSFAHNIMLPILQKVGNLVGIATSNGINAVFASRKYHFRFGTVSPQRLIGRDYINTNFILTRHNKHATQVIQSLRAGKHTFVEKPLCLTLQELEEITIAYSSLPQPRPLLMLGFNRRFSPAIQEAAKYLQNDIPRAINIRVNAGSLPPEHWIYDIELGGGRIIGEGCHFIDLAYYLAGSKAISVQAAAMGTANNLQDTMNISIQYENGSIANISYFSNGNKKIEKEVIEVFCGQTVIKIDDFRSTLIQTPSVKKKFKLKKQDKGHKNEVIYFLEAIKEGRPVPIPFDEIIHSMHTTLLVNTSLQEGRSVKV